MRRVLKAFLFHTGSIKRMICGNWSNPLLEFLFHTGSIKRAPMSSCRRFAKSSFYSILVRLKAAKSRFTAEERETLVSIPYWFD